MSGCEANPTATIEAMDKIELLFWDGCPSYPEALALLRGVLDERGIEVPIDLLEVRTHEEALSMSFPGSPTIRVDGRDIDPEGATGRAGLACRIYRLPDGHVSPVPSRAQLEDGLK